MVLNPTFNNISVISWRLAICFVDATNVMIAGKLSFSCFLFQVLAWDTNVAVLNLLTGVLCMQQGRGMLAS
jgi:hypothetical protein